MSDSSVSGATQPGGEPKIVMDAAGNLWHRYGDVGYVLLITSSRAQYTPHPTLTALVNAVGPVQRMVAG